jgi:phosphatidylethanolamine-binding protein (PEBP) family uncharacterized protein
VAATLVVVLAACGTSGRELRAAAPGATAPPRSTSTSTTAPTAAAPIGLSIVSSAWGPGEPIPATFSCDGAGVSPPLQLGGSETAAAELVVIATDPDAGGRVHWVLAGLDPSGATIDQGTPPASAVVGLNTAGTAQWEPLCPPAGATHMYEFTVHALAGPSGISGTTTAAEAQALVETQAVASAAMTGTYTRRG